MSTSVGWEIQTIKIEGEGGGYTAIFSELQIAYHLYHP